MFNNQFKEIKTIKPEFKARKLMSIFDKYLLVGEDNAKIVVYNKELTSVCAQYQFFDESGVRDMVVLVKKPSEMLIALGTMNGIKLIKVMKEAGGQL